MTHYCVCCIADRAHDSVDFDKDVWLVLVFVTMGLIIYCVCECVHVEPSCRVLVLCP